MQNINRKIFVVFSLVSLIPLLVFIYLMLLYLMPEAKYVRLIFPIIFITIIIVILGFFLLKSIGKNVNNVSKSAKIIAQGDITHEVNIKGNEEVVELAESINKITQKLRNDINDLETQTILVERSNKELNRLNKLKSEFVSMVSHELRAPLINIKQSSSLILQMPEKEFSQEEERSLEIINRNAERLLKLISDLLDISRIETGTLSLNPKIINIDSIIKEAVESLERWAQLKKLGVKLEIEPNLPDIYVDSERVNQVIVNLLSNAIKFTPTDGQITIKVGLQKKKDSLEISVIDTGIGIPENQLDKIFNPFTQVSDTSVSPTQMQGIGLGLSITKEIVKMHGGQIQVESKQGRGSKFTFTLPLTKEKDT